jgi:hypothetical protein
MDKVATGMYDLLDAVEAVVKAVDPSRREALAQTIDAYSESFPDDFFWAIGPMAPTLLSRLLRAIDLACRPDEQLTAGDLPPPASAKPRGTIFRLTPPHDSAADRDQGCGL